MVPIHLIMSLVGNILALVFCTGYAIYTFLRKGVHVKGRGWKTKDEAPKSYYFTLGILIVVSIFSFGAIIFRLYTYYLA